MCVIEASQTLSRPPSTILNSLSTLLIAIQILLSTHNGSKQITAKTQIHNTLCKLLNTCDVTQRFAPQDTTQRTHNSCNECTSNDQQSRMKSPSHMNSCKSSRKCWKFKIQSTKLILANHSSSSLSMSAQAMAPSTWRLRGDLHRQCAWRPRPCCPFRSRARAFRFVYRQSDIIANAIHFELADAAAQI